MNLSDLKIGEIGIIERIISTKHTQGIVQRLKAMGVVSNKPVQILQEAKFCSQLHVRVGSSTEIAIPPQAAEMIIVKTNTSSEDTKIIPETPQELAQQVKIESLVSLAAIIIVFISGFYRILITRDIHQVNEEKVMTNIVDASGLQLQKKSTFNKIDGSQDQTKKVINIETVNNKSDSPEKPNKRSSQNIKNNFIETTHFPPPKIEQIDQKITNKIELSELKQKLYNTIYQGWKNPINVTSIYLVKVDKKGGITYYEPLNQVAADNLKKTPIPSLVKSDSTTRTESLKTEWAEFTILFYGNDVLEIQAR